MENMKRKKDGITPSEKVNLPEKVAHFYYSHGLLCSSHPVVVLCFAISVVLLCSYPLINLPLPGDTPIQTITSSHNLTIPDNLTVFSGKPAAYIQQIVLKTGVSPWQEGMTVCDAFRAPLHQVFSLLETIRNFQVENSSQSLSDLCLHVETVKFKSSEERKKLFPEYNCLVLSPANFWQQNENNFQSDANLMGTIFNYHNIQKGKISLTEILFGVDMKESGLKRHPLRSRPRILQYAVTLVLSVYDQRYISGLRSKLEQQFPLHAGDSQNSSKPHRQLDETIHVFYPGEFNLHELLPLATVFLLLFLYIYYSLRKVEPVKSKLGIAFSAVISILSCLCMSIGLCFFFGLTVSVNGKDLFPYLVVIVGLENVLVITKSITTTPAHLDVKIRVAQGLSREGWSITKNLLIQVTILTIGFGTFVSAIQELCILGIVGLVCDFFLQLFFFTTVLSIDIHRTESDFESRNNYYYHSLPVQKVLTSNKFGTAPYDKPYLRYYTQENKNLMRSKSHHNLSSGLISSTSQPATYPTNVLARSAPILNKIPKRLKLVNIWASTRFFQRAFMVALVMWMCFILYTAKLVQEVLQVDEIAKFHEKLQVPNVHRKVSANSVIENMNELKSFSALISEDPSSGNNRHEGDLFEGEDADLSRFKHRDQDSHRRLSLYHWPVMMSLYNISLTGKYITILPSIRISQTISPESAIYMRNPNDKITSFQWKSLAVALDPLDFSTSDVSKSASLLTGNTDSPFIPRSPMEIALSFILVVVSVFVLAYMTMVLYRCICSRNYAEWRSSWYSSPQPETDTQVVLEAVPTSLEGHSQEIECLVSDGLFVVSSCLSGEVRIWNSSDGELVSQIDRQKYFSRNPTDCSGPESDHHSDYESGSPPSVGEMDLTSQRKNSCAKVSTDCTVFNLVSSLNEKGVYNRKKQESESFLKPNINFSGLRLSSFGGRNQRERDKGFDFETPYKSLRKEGSSSSMEELEGSEVGPPSGAEESESRVPMNGDKWNCLVDPNLEVEFYVNSESSGNGKSNVAPIWCLDCSNNVIAVGCSNGRVEFWECSTGKLQCTFEEGNHVGVTSIKLFDNRVIVARLNGSLDLLVLDSQTRRQSDWEFTPSRRSHVRTGSVGSVRDWEKCSEDLKCRKVITVKAHQQPITVLECESGRIVTGSQDHTLKVLRIDNCSLQYTLHGHCGPITCMFIDKVTPFLSGSGSHDGLLCFWDLLTGACLYSIQAHDGSICALTYSASYVISLGTDERICVWERFLGHLLNTIQVMHTFCSSMVMLTHNLLVTSKQGSLVMWDVRTGEPVRIVRLGNSDHSVFVKQILNLGDSVVCDYGSQLRIDIHRFLESEFEYSHFFISISPSPVVIVWAFVVTSPSDMAVQVPTDEGEDCSSHLQLIAVTPESSQLGGKGVDLFKQRNGD